MKKLLIALSIILIGGISFAQVKTKKTDSPQHKPKPDKYHDNIDDRMKGPNNELIYIGANGGRYYLKNGRKIYVPLKKNKKK